MTEPKVKYMNVSVKRHQPEHRDKLFFGESWSKVEEDQMEKSKH